MEERKFVLPESLLSELLTYISNSRSDLTSGRVVTLVDKLRDLKQVEKDEKKDTQG